MSLFHVIEASLQYSQRGINSYPVTEILDEKPKNILCATWESILGPPAQQLSRRDKYYFFKYRKQSLYLDLLMGS